MRKLLPLLFSLFTANCFAQLSLTDYSIASRIDSNCMTAVTLPLFAPGERNDVLNELIVDELTKHHFLFQKHLVHLKAFYQNRFYTGDSTLGFTLLAGCTFKKNGLYSFTGCPFNACDNKPRSEMETVMAVLDSTRGKLLGLKDVIEPSKYDSLVGFVMKVANRYGLKNLPTCSYESTDPIVVKSSGNTMSGVNQVTYHPELDSRFYLKYNSFQVYLMATHTAYVYNCVEIPLPLQMIRYFLRPEYATRIFD